MTACLSTRSTRASAETLGDRGLVAIMLADKIVARQHSGEQRARAKYRNFCACATLDHEWGSGISTRVIASFTDLENRRQGEVDEPDTRTARVRDERLFQIVGLRIENSLAVAEARRLWGDYEYASEVHVLPDVPFPGSPGFDRTLSAAPTTGPSQS